MRYYMGIDPDVNCTAWAIINDSLEVTHTGIIKQKLKGWCGVRSMANAVALSIFPVRCNTVVIESQQVYTSGASRTKNPDSVLMIANVSGQLLAKFMGKAFLAKPVEWKQQQTKYINQMRTFKKLGITDYKVMGTPGNNKKGDTRYLTPFGLDHTATMPLRAGDWKHISDALGLALYARGLDRNDR